MQVTIFLIIIQYFIVVIECEMDSFIIGGEKAEAGEFPYSAHLGIACSKKQGYLTLLICGSSIINQNLLLTAAHCLYDCTYKSSIAISVGNTLERKNGAASSNVFLIHEKYEAGGYTNDLALVRTSNPLTLNQNVARVALLKDPPYKKEATVAGWGKFDRLDETTFRYSDPLMYTKQYVMDSKECFKLLDFDTKEIICALSEGIICARSNTGSELAKGDSGSALVVDDYIQIGIALWKQKKGNNLNIEVYTDVGFHYDWINEAAENITCIDYEEKS